jgi:hypothetical protein
MSFGRVREVDPMDSLAQGLPASAERIRRRFWRDAEFRTVCEDYRDAVETLARLGPGDVARIEEYRQLAGELLAEASTMLDGEQP